MGHFSFSKDMDASISSEVQERLRIGGCYLRRVSCLESSVPEKDMVGLGDAKQGDL